MTQDPSPWSRDGWQPSGTPAEQPGRDGSYSVAGPPQPAPQAGFPAAGGTPYGPSYQGAPYPSSTPPTLQQPRRDPKRRSGLAGLLTVAVLAGSVGGGTGYLASRSFTPEPAASVTTSPSATSSTNQESQTTVVQADPSNPNWAPVAEVASKAVAAIRVMGADGNGGQGSGVVIDREGHIVTNNHVIAGGAGAQIVAMLGDSSYRASVVGTDPTTDLAVIKLDEPPADLATMAYGDSEQLVVGDEVMAIGNPLGLADTVTTGIVSALNRPVTTRAVGNSNASNDDIVVTAAIQTNAAINPGNSGGALVNTAGELVGITSSIASLPAPGASQAGNIGIGFAIGSDQVQYVVEQLIASGTAQHPQLGVTATDVTATGRMGAVVASVVDGSAAATGGLREGDLITAVDGASVTSTQQLVALVRAGRVGEDMTITVLRDGESSDVTVRPSAAPR